MKGRRLAIVGAWLLAACGDEAGEPRVVAGTTTVAFGERPVGSVSPRDSVAFVNEGDSPVRVAGARIDGEGAGAFLVARDGCADVELEPGRACLVRLAFVPTAPGTREATLVVDLETDATPVAVRLVGSGRPEATVAGPVATVTPATLSFGGQPVGTASGPLGVSLRNEGTGTLRVDLRLDQDVRGEFSLASDACSNRPLAAGAECRAGVVFRPRADGRRSATLVLRDLQDGTTQAVEVTGTGAPGASPSDTLLRPGPGRLTFTAARAGDRSAPQEVTFVNVGDRPGAVENVRVAGIDAADFEIVENRCLGALLAPGERCRVRVRFVPVDEGRSRASLVAVAPDGARTEIPLVGTAPSVP